MKWEEFPVLIDLIGLITSADFNRLSIDLEFVIIDLRISATSLYISIRDYMNNASSVTQIDYAMCMYVYVCMHRCIIKRMYTLHK